MRVVVFFSGGASSLRAMLGDENHGRLYRVTGAYTDKEDAKGRQLCRDNGIPDLFISRKKFYSDRGLDPKNWDSRKRFYEMLARELEQFNPNVICLSGYMHILTDPLLTEYESRILNVHPADLSILSSPAVQRLDVSGLPAREAKKLAKTNDLSRKLKGENAVYDAIIAGENFTRSTIHIATEDFDEGPIVVQSKPFPVASQARIASELARSFAPGHEAVPGIHEKLLKGVTDALQEYSSSLQGTMKTEGDGPAYLKALELFFKGRLSSDGETLLLDDAELPYCGLRLE
jgi:folate-dependent phosphoribosylglycinamide formyltransferase PurN